VPPAICNEFGDTNSLAVSLENISSATLGAPLDSVFATPASSPSFSVGGVGGGIGTLPPDGGGATNSAGEYFCLTKLFISSSEYPASLAL
jgi:hypothetical protein